MSVRTDPSMTGSSAPPAAYEDETRGYGWVIFSGTMLAILGTVNIIAGIGAIDDSKFYVHGAKYVFGDLNTWGWIVLITGSAQLLTAFGVWARSNVATWAGVLFAGLNSIVALMNLPSFPLFGLCLLALDVCVIYGLAVHGGRD